MTSEIRIASPGAGTRSASSSSSQCQAINPKLSTYLPISQTFGGVDDNDDHTVDEYLDPDRS